MLFLLCLSCFSWLSLSATGAENRSFDIPAGKAADTLRQFTAQTGADERLLYSVEAIAGIRTNAVRGEMTAHEALDQMITGTGLVVLADKKGGGFTLTRNSDPNAPRLAQKNSDQPTSPSSESKDDVLKLTALIVTGSNIPTAADATDVPVVVLGQKQIENTGLNANLLEILRKSVPAFAGRSNTGNSNATNTNQYTAGGSQIALRNLSTLVLVNGRRMATSSVNGVNGKSFVDINQIAVAAIDRIEVLTDGASAIYGSDAIGGVVNIITKSTYQGAEVGGRFAVTANQGHYSERSGYVVVGGAVKGVSITVSGSWSKTDPLREKDRPFVSSVLKTGTNFPGFVGGNYLNPSLGSPSQSNSVGANATATNIGALVANGTYMAPGNPSIPLFDVAPFVSVLLQQEQKAAVANFSAVLIDRKLTVFGDFMYSATTSSTQTAAVFANFRAVTVAAGAPYNPLTTDVSGVLVGSTQTPMQTLNSAKGYRFTLGFRGEINPNWNWEVGYMFNRNAVEQQLTNNLFRPNLNAAIAGGFDAAGNAVANGAFSKVLAGFSTSGALVVQPALNPFARSGINPASLANVYGTEVINTAGSLASLDAKIVGLPFRAPAGKIGFVVGAATRREKLSATPDANSYNASTDPSRNNWTTGLFFDPFASSRTVDAFYGEVRVPLTGESWSLPGVRALDLSLAGRYERYSDYGNSRVPKIGLRWQPYDKQLTLRFTYSKSFAAPTLYDEFGPTSFAPGSSSAPGGILVPIGVTSTTSYFIGTSGNPNLQPATAQSRSMGLALSPRAIKGLTISLDYINVLQSGFPAGIDGINIVASVNTLGSASPFFSSVTVKGAPGQAGTTQAPISVPGGLAAYFNSPGYAGDVYILDRRINAGGVRNEALDVAVAYERRIEGWGTFTFETTGSYLISRRVSAVRDAPFYEFAGYSTNGSLMAGTAPQFSAYTTVEWRNRGNDITLGNSYMSSTVDIGSGRIPEIYLSTNSRTKVAAYASWNLQFSHTVAKGASGYLGYAQGMRFTIGVNNLANKMPPLAPRSYPASSNNANADVSTYSPIGRLYFISASLKY